MIKPELPSNEAERLEVLRQLHILDTPAEPAFDDLAVIAATICGTPRAALTLVDSDRQWFKAATGVPRSEAPRDISFCAHAINRPAELLLVEDTLDDPRFRDNPMVVGLPPVRFYAGAPLLSEEGYGLGTLCVFGDQPARLSPEQQRALMALSRQAAYLLQLRRVSRTLEQLVRDRDWYEQQLERYHSSLVAENADLAVQTRTDPLTGLPNRRAFTVALDAAVVSAQQEREPVAVAMLDIDHFKAINDQHGHDRGDQVLVALSDLLRAHSAGSGTAARFGGEEFVLLMPGAGHELAQVQCEYLRESVSLLPLNLAVTISIGVAVLKRGEAVDQMLKRADEALYEAKRTGRNRVVVAQ